MTGFLPYGRQTIEDDDVAAVAAALRGDFLTTGPKVEEYEGAFARATGAAHAVACNSGTAALHLAALAAGLGPGDAAVVPAATFLATANAVRMTGAEVVFADVDPDTGLMTAETLAAALARAPRDHTARAALPVHLNGQVCDMAALAAVARAKGVALIEDACHALGVEGIGATPHAQSACFSTHPVKAIATAEGGVVTTADADLAARMRSLRSHGMVREPDAFTDRARAFEDGEANPWWYEMPEVGWNYRLPDVLCALGVSQLAKLDRFHRRRVEIARRYDALLAPLFPRLRPVPHGNHPHGWHIYAVLVEFAALGTTRARFMAALRAEGVGTQVHYIPVHLQPYYRKRYGDLRLPGAEAYYARCLSIPLFPAMTDEDVRHVADSLARLVGSA
ncbi:MAG: UDP-4-amino-4,6-dideoxy-N-acetyl-beta-L-altrosamine transaminase [Bradyrhizobiaceae bacterium]|nr:MAG: UDP-4-amino-4,6-dideoxy-N-acetyl-beta-L-altrosamine transaminase [Bradyrhizobiaceae bacterium]